MTSVTTPAGATSKTYDVDSLVLTITDPNGHTVTNTYDSNGRPLTATQANGDMLRFTYDGNLPGGGSIAGQKGVLSSRTDGNNHTTTFTYTARNQQASACYPDNTSEAWSYNEAGAVAAHQDGKGQVINYAYDNAGQLANIIYPSGNGAGSGVSYTYDVAGRKTGMTDVTGTSGFVYDDANRVTSIQAPNGTTNYAYDNANRKTSMALAGTGTWAYGYDNANRVITVQNPYAETAAYSYDAVNKITQLVNGNGSKTLYGYDNAGCTTDIWHEKSDGVTLLAHYQYAYDAGCNVTSRTDSDGSVTTFGYDPSDQLTSEVRTGSNAYTLAYSYDHNGNRLTKTLNGATENYAYDAHDKLLSAGAKSYTYDANGNCTSVRVGSNAPTALTYDVENRVTQIVYPNSTTNAFVYNGEDLRVGKTDSSGTQAYKTDGVSVASPVLADSAATYTPGLSERRGATSKFYHQDALGSTRGITDSSQSVTDAQVYDAFGMTVSRTGTTPTPFGFVGASQYHTDGDSGLQLLGHRYYDSSIGRFLSSDPAHSGSNWYKYANNNPLKNIDPLGLFNWGRTIGGVLAGVAGGIVGGPIGAAVAVGIFEGVYTYGETGNVGAGVVSGVIGAGTTYIGGKLITAAIAKCVALVADGEGGAVGGAVTGGTGGTGGVGGGGGGVGSGGGGGGGYHPLVPGEDLSLRPEITDSPYLPTNDRISAGAVNSNAQNMLQNPGGVDWTQGGGQNQITFDPSTGGIVEGHHRLIASLITGTDPPPGAVVTGPLEGSQIPLSWRDVEVY